MTPWAAEIVKETRMTPAGFLLGRYFVTIRDETGVPLASGFAHSKRRARRLAWTLIQRRAEYLERVERRAARESAKPRQVFEIADGGGTADVRRKFLRRYTR